MKRITKLTLKNFKAFRNQEFPFNGKHTLIFGNNGAGKSSVYWALHAFLHSTAKAPTEVAKYFSVLDQYDPTTYESIRNLYAPHAEDAFVEVVYAETGQTGYTDRISGAGTTTSRQQNQALHTAYLASDFIHYRFLQDFYAYTNKHEINLWPVFERDLFPYFTPEPSKGKQTLTEIFTNLKSGPPKGPTGTRTVKAGTEAMQAYEQRLNQFNAGISRFVDDITQSANAILKKHFFGDVDQFEIEISYPNPITLDELRNVNGLINSRLPLRVRVPDPDKPGDKLPVYRPQAFLNEAQLTRIALAVRLGALQTRPYKTEFQILCLDDLLISLDMVNRQHVLDWLFDPTTAITIDYQVFFFTHDWELFKMVRHYATSRQPQAWNVFELSVDEDAVANKREPQLLINSADYYEQAVKHYNKRDLPACANYLRKEFERIMKLFLSPAQVYTVPQESGDPGFKTLGDLIGLMKQVFHANDVDLGDLVDLGWSKDSALNALSHDSYGTTTYQEELRKLTFVIFPKLRELNGRTLKKLDTEKETFLELIEPDSNGIKHLYKVRLHEQIRELTFPNKVNKISASRCTIISHLADGVEEALTHSEKKCRTIKCLYDAIRSKLLANGKALPNRTLYDALPNL